MPGPEGHPTPAELEQEDPGPLVLAHLSECAACRVDRRLLRSGVGDPVTTCDLPLGGVDLPPLPRWSATSSPDPIVEPAAPGASLGPGDMVDHFEVVRAIGRGGMGEVYLARDTRLGRQVALKVLREDVSADADLRRRILREARLTARFAHPHIVTLHEVGEHHGRPYLALEYLEGQTLRERLATERPGQREALRIALAVALALQEAHAHGVVHRDLKPENVLLPVGGRVRVVDFGLARPSPRAWEASAAPAGSLFESRQGQVAGTPCAMAPEQWRAEPVSAATDTWAWGLLLYELLTGRRAFPGTNLAELRDQVLGTQAPPPLQGVPDEVGSLVARCLERDPAQRPRADELVAVLQASLGGRDPAASDDEPPFRGLLPFDDRHALAFVGRESEVAALVERLRTETVLAVVGPSGVGKSSLVAAGLVPRLREHGQVTVLRIRPGADPMDALVARLARAGASSASLPPPSSTPPDADPGDLRRRIETSPEYLGWALQQLARRLGGSVLLFVDQLEELFTLVQDEGTRRAFARALCAVGDDPELPLRVVFTLRDDFLVRMAETEQARRVLQRLAVIHTPAEPELREILTVPVQRRGYRYEDPRLVDEMIAEIGGQPAGLPLLQFAGAQLWRLRDSRSRILTRAAYQAIGGVAGALARHADGVVEAMPPAQVAATRGLLLRLVTAEGTRRVVQRRDLLAGLPSDAAAALDTLVEARILLAGRAAQGEEAGATVELVHESLVESWGMLAAWIEAGRAEVAFLREAEAAAALWEGRGRPDAEVWTGEALWEARRKAERAADVPPSVQVFLRAGWRVEQRGRRRRRRILALGGAALALVAVGALLAALLVQRQRDAALVQGAAAQLAGAEAAIAASELLEAAARTRASLEAVDSPGARAAWWQISTDPLAWRRTGLGAGLSLDLSPDGRTLAADGMRALLLIDTATGAGRLLRGHTETVSDVAWSQDGRSVVSADAGGTMLLWDIADQTSTALVPDPKPDDADVNVVAFGPGGARLYVGRWNPVIEIWDPQARRQVGTLVGHADAVWGLVVDPGGRWLWSASRDGTLRSWDLTGETPPRVLQAHDGGASALAAARSADGPGARLVSGGWDGRVVLWDMDQGAVLREIAAHEGRVQSLTVSPDGGSVASVGSDGRVLVHSLGSGALLHRFDVRKPVFDVRFSRDGRRLFTSDEFAMLRVWRLDVPTSDALGLAGEAGGHTMGLNQVVFSPDGSYLATGSDDWTARTWDADTGRTKVTLRGHEGEVSSIAALPGTEGVVTASFDASVREWDLTVGRVRQTWGGHRRKAGSVAVSPDGRWLASGDIDGQLRLQDRSGQVPPRVLVGHDQMVIILQFDAAGARLVSGSFDRTARVWDRSTGALLRTLAHGAPVWGAAFHPDGRTLATGSREGKVRLWDLDTGALLRSFDFEGGGSRLAWHPAGRLLGLGGRDGSAVLLDTETGEQRAMRGHVQPLSSVAFSPDGRLYATAGWDGSLRLWDVASASPTWRGALLRGEADEVHTHLGWSRASDGAALEPAPAAWRQAVATRGRAASEAAGLLCMATFDQALELWDVEDDRMLARLPVGWVDGLRALPGGCVGRVAGLVLRWSEAGAARVLATGVAAHEVDGDGLLVVLPGQVQALGAGGEVRERWDTDVDVTAVARVGEALALGFADGALELLRPDPAGGPPRRLDLDASGIVPVVRIAPGPRGTLTAGSADGAVGLWALDTGARLRTERLHGAVVHLASGGGHVFALSDLGQRLAWDLTVMELPYCDLLRRIWAESPLALHQGRVVAAPPARHRCRDEAPGP